MPARAVPPMGSGERTSSITEAVAVYFLGSSKLTATAAHTVTSSTSRADRQRACRMEMNCPSVMTQVKALRVFPATTASRCRR